MQISLSTRLVQQIKEWLKDFENTQPKNVGIADDSFEGGAYFLLKRVLDENKKIRNTK